MKRCLQCFNAFSAHEWNCPRCGHRPLVVDGIEMHAPNAACEGGSFKREYFENLVTAESGSFWFESRNRIICWSLQKFKSECRNFLEIGCGTGFVLSGVGREIPNARLYGSEIFSAGLSYAIERVPQAIFMQMDARKIPFFEEFDVLGAFDVLEHIEEDEMVLSQIYMALKRDGVLLLTVPQHKWLWSASDDYACHARRYEKSELHEKIERAGFSIQRSTSFVGILLPVMMVSRLIKKNTTYDPDAELRIPFIVNFLFKMIMGLEFFFIRNGINIPFGGSRLVVAKKI